MSAPLICPICQETLSPTCCKDSGARASSLDRPSTSVATKRPGPDERLSIESQRTLFAEIEGRNVEIRELRAENDRLRSILEANARALGAITVDDGDRGTSNDVAPTPAPEGPTGAQTQEKP